MNPIKEPPETDEVLPQAPLTEVPATGKKSWFPEKVNSGWLIILGLYAVVVTAIAFLK